MSGTIQKRDVVNIKLRGYSYNLDDIAFVIVVSFVVMFLLSIYPLVSG